MMKFSGITFSKDFKAKIEKNFSDAQKYVDSEAMRLSDPYTPFLTGMMKRSVTLGTKIGSGELKYTAPYARRQYYTNAGRGKQGITKESTHNYKCLRGKLWFERMKADHKEEIVEGVKKKFK